MRNVIRLQFLTRDSMPLVSYQITRSTLIRVSDDFLIALQFRRLTTKVTINNARKIVSFLYQLYYFFFDQNVYASIFK